MSFARKMRELLDNMEQDGNAEDQAIARDVRAFLQDRLTEAAGGDVALMVRGLLP